MILAEQAAGTHGEVPQGSGPSTAHKGGRVPMELGAAQGQSREPRGKGNSNGKRETRTYHYCKQQGYLILNFRKLEAGMQAHKDWTGLGATGRSFGARQGHSNPYSDLVMEEDRSPSPVQGNKVRN